MFTRARAVVMAVACALPIAFAASLVSSEDRQVPQIPENVVAASMNVATAWPDRAGDLPETLLQDLDLEGTWADAPGLFGVADTQQGPTQSDPAFGYFNLIGQTPQGEISFQCLRLGQDSIADLSNPQTGGAFLSAQTTLFPDAMTQTWATLAKSILRSVPSQGATEVAQACWLTFLVPAGADPATDTALITAFGPQIDLGSFDPGDGSLGLRTAGNEQPIDIGDSTIGSVTLRLDGGTEPTETATFEIISWRSIPST